MFKKLALLALVIGCNRGEPATDDSGGDTDTTTGGANHAEACAGSYSGAFSGDDSGDLTAELAADGTIDITFFTFFGEVLVSGTVAEDGTLAAEAVTAGVATVLDGTYDLTACTGTGTWRDDQAQVAGDWTLTKD